MARAPRGKSGSRTGHTLSRKGAATKAKRIKARKKADRKRR